MPKSEQRSISFAQVLREEYRVLRENTEWAADTEQGLFRKMHDREAPLSALCISGGGLRSATFALGAIQAFAEKGILTDFDYLSTVSGGGYIGGWLSAWKQREQGLEKIIPKLKPTAPAHPRGTVDPVQHLREYNSYLTPKLGLLSTDTWTLAATIGRNMLLNWLVLVPILMFGLMIPRLVLALARLGVTLQAFYGDAIAQYADTVVVDAIPVIGGFLFAMGIFNTLRYLPGVGNKNHSEFDFVKYVLIPFISAAATFIAFDSWGYSNDAGNAASLPEFRYFLLWITGSGACGWIAYLILAGREYWNRPWFVARISGAILLVCFSTSCCAWLLVAKLYNNVSWPAYLVTGAPTLSLLAFMLAQTLFV